MIDPLQALLQVGARANLFPPSSRYHGAETAEWLAPDGKMIAYLRRRFVPAPEQLAQLAEHTVEQGDRLDNLAARYLGDPELFWRLCDANAALRPDELTEEVGRRLRITLPAGMPGGQHA
jgi:hypothetical protein